MLAFLFSILKANILFMNFLNNIMFYELSKEERKKLKEKIIEESKKREGFLKYSADKDIFIRKIAAKTLGNEKDFEFLHTHIMDLNELRRQAIAYAMMWIGKKNPKLVIDDLRFLASDESKHVRNACVEALKEIGKSNPGIIADLLKPWLKDENVFVRKCAVHGIELAGRDIDPAIALKLLRLAKKDESRIVQDMIIHVLTQISYKHGPKKIFEELKKWVKNANEPVKRIAKNAVSEILKFHKEKPKFCATSYKEAFRLAEKYKLA